MNGGTHHIDAWSALRQRTPARIALGRAGGSLPTGEVTDFNIAHAAARDAVAAELDVAALEIALAPLGLPRMVLTTQAPDRPTYLKRPDLGRRLDASSSAALQAKRGYGGCDIVLIVADGLSAAAPQKQAPPLLGALLPMLTAAGLCVGPICIARQARVAVQDEIGAALGARLAVILLGERPGLSSAESLGAYLVYQPSPGRTDAQRNCVSNIRDGGLPCAQAAATLNHLIGQSLQRQVSGVALKDDREAHLAVKVSELANGDESRSGSEQRPAH